MYFYAARQPILNRDKELIGYELLFRDGVDNVFPDIDQMRRNRGSACIVASCNGLTRAKITSVNQHDARRHCPAPTTSSPHDRRAYLEDRLNFRLMR